MTKANDISLSELSSVFRYDDDGKLFRFNNKSKIWKEVRIYKCNSGSGYAQTSFKGKNMLVHRIIYSLFYKVNLSADLQIDHINGNRVDNRICNLELVTHRKNGQNQKCHRNGHPCGTTWQHGKWIAKISIDGKQKYLGRFSTAEEAAATYAHACAKLRGAVCLGT